MRADPSCDGAISRKNLVSHTSLLLNFTAAFVFFTLIPHTERAFVSFDFCLKFWSGVWKFLSNCDGSSFEERWSKFCRDLLQLGSVLLMADEILYGAISVRRKLE